MLPKSRLLIPILLAALLSSQPHAFASKPSNKPMPAPPLGLKWRENMDDVKKALFARGYTETDYTYHNYSDAARFIAHGDSIYGQKVDSVFVILTTGLYSVTITYPKPSTLQETLAQFHSIARNLAVSFGPAQEAIYKFTAPYKAGDGHEIDAIQNNKGKVEDGWGFFPPPTHPDTGMIQESITNAPNVQILYFNVDANTPFLGEASATQIVIDKPLPAAPLGLTWGDRFDTVKQALYNRGFNNAKLVDRSNNVVQFSSKKAANGHAKGVTIDGESIQLVTITTGTKGLSNVEVTYTTQSNDKDTLAQFHRIAQQIATSCGPPSSIQDYVWGLYKSGDEVAAVKNRKGTMSEGWQLTPANSKTAWGVISIYISDQAQVVVMYFDQNFN